MSGVVSFGDYTFNFLQEFSDNFGDTTPQTIKLPGMDGAWNDDGMKPSATATGKITLGFQLLSDTREGMDALRDEVSAMIDYGLAKLVYQPTDPNEATRYCWARVNNIQMSERKDEHTDLWQKVQIIFQAPEPIWHTGEYGGIFFGPEAGDFGEGLVFGDGALEVVCSGTLTSTTITNNGNTSALLKINLAPQAPGDSFQNADIRRVVGSQIADQVTYEGTVSYGDQLEIDGKRRRITISGANAWANAEASGPDLIRLLPGANTIQIRFENSGDECTAFLYFFDAYR